MMKKKLLTLAVTLSLIIGVFSCKDTKQVQENQDSQMKQIDAAEVSIDSTLNRIDQKVGQVKDIINEIDNL